MDQKSKIKKILNEGGLKIIKKLSTPHKVQDFLDTLPFNFEEKGETYYSPKIVLKEKKAHCFEGALFAHLCLTYHNFENYIVDLKTKSIKEDSDHIICTFRINKFWGAISKTNHSVLRWRDPIYRDTEELAKTYFHEYFLDNGKKTLFSFSKPLNIFKIFGEKWVIAEKDLDQIAEKIDESLHQKFVPEKNLRLIRKVGKTEIKGASIEEWHKNKKIV